MDNFSDKLIRLRKKNNYSMKEAAKLLDVPYTTYVGWEKGKTPNLEMLSKIANAFNVKTSYFLKEELTYEEINERYKKIGSLVKYYREQKHMSQRDLEKLTFLPDFVIDNIEKGRNIAGLYFKLAEIAFALTIPYSWLIEDENGKILINIRETLLTYLLRLKNLGYTVEISKIGEVTENFYDIPHLNSEDLIIITTKNKATNISLPAIDFLDLVIPLYASAKNVSREFEEKTLVSSIKNSIEALMLLGQKNSKLINFIKQKRT